MLLFPGMNAEGIFDLCNNYRKTVVETPLLLPFVHMTHLDPVVNRY